MSDFFQPELIQQLVDGIGRGSGYALLALGLTIVFGMMHLVNFAYGELITVAAYVAYFLSINGANWWAMAAAIIVTAIVCAVIIDFVAFRRVRESSDFTMLLTSFGVVILVQASFSQWVELKPRNFKGPGWVFDTVIIRDDRFRLQIHPPGIIHPAGPAPVNSLAHISIEDIAGEAGIKAIIAVIAPIEVPGNSGACLGIIGVNLRKGEARSVASHTAIGLKFYTPLILLGCRNMSRAGLKIGHRGNDFENGIPILDSVILGRRQDILIFVHITFVDLPDYLPPHTRILISIR